MIETSPRRGSSRRRALDLKRILDVSLDHHGEQLDPLFERVGRTATQILDCDRASIFLLDRDRNELHTRFASGLTGSGLTEIRFPVDRGIAGLACRTGRIIHVPTPYDDPRFNQEVDRRTGYRTRSILCCPIRGHEGDIIGVLQALNKRRGAFDRADQHKISLLRGAVELALQRHLLLDELADKRRLHEELAAARRIQQRIMPRGAPHLPGFDIAGWNRSAAATGGDCYDFLPLPDGSLAIALADAVGHGIAAALVISAFSAMFRATMLHTHDLGHAVEQVNQLMLQELPDDHFVTAFFGRLGPAGRLTFASAGQGPILLYRAATGDVLELPPHGLPLGIQADAVQDEPTDMQLQSGDVLALFTDGFFQSFRAGGEEFGIDRLANLVRLHSDEPAAALIQRVHEAVAEFTGAVPQTDDLTAVIIKKT